MERMEGQSEANQGNQYSHIQVAGGRNILGNVTNIESEDPLRHLPYASGGPSNSYSRQHDPRCLPGTRVDLLQEIDEWAKTHDQRFLYWLSGWAGTGKTTIALTISDNVQKHGRLGASFFFSKGGGDVSHAGRFVTSIALQLAQNVPDLREHIKRVLRKRINISSESLREQWLHLVIHPLMTLNYIESVSHPWILVVDALDECDDNNNIVMIVQLLAELQTLGKPPLRVLLTSRPQTRIKDTLAQMMDFTLHETVLHDISPDTVNGDIIRFLGHKLRLIRETGVENDDWPGDQAIAQLAQHAANLFIWASTACSFIEDGPIPDESLQLLLQGAAEIGDEASPEEHLDAIYRTVLRSAIQSNWTVRKKAGLLDLLKHVLGSIVTLFAPLALEPLSKLIDTPKPKVELVTKDLRAILDIPKSQDFPLRLHHPSFRDFLLVQDRCQDPDFHVDERQAHQKLAGRCFQVMSEALGQDICGVGSPDAAATDVSTEFVDQHITAEAQYACLYWTRHVCESGILLQDDGIVHEFLKTYLLCWLEALSWLRRVSDSIQAISSLQTIIPKSACPLLSNFLIDAKSFILSSSTTIRENPLQTYSSALVFAPSTNMVKQRYHCLIPKWIQTMPLIPEDRSDLLLTIDGNTRLIKCVAFSPDGKTIASASIDGVRLWDSSTGASKQTLRCGAHRLLYSQNGQWLATMYMRPYGTVELWDAVKGTLCVSIHGLIDESGLRHLLFFSADCADVISVSPHGVRRQWNSITGETKDLPSGRGEKSWTLSGTTNNELVSYLPSERLIEISGVETGSVHKSYKVEQLQSAKHNDCNASLSPDRKTLAINSGSGTGKIYVFEEAKLPPVHTLEGPLLTRYLEFSPDRMTLVAAQRSTDQPIMLWNSDNGTLKQTLRGHLEPISSLAFSPDSRSLATAAGREIKLWDIGKIPDQVLKKPLDGIQFVVFSRDGLLLASTSRIGSVKIWDTKSGTALHTLEGHTKTADHAAFSSDGSVLISASFHGETVIIWDVVSGEKLHTLESPGQVYSVSISSDDHHIATAAFNGGIGIWSVSTGLMSRKLKVDEPVDDVKFGPAGKLLASASRDEKVRLWDVEKGAVLHSFEGFAFGVQCLSFSPSGKLLACGSHEGIVRVWDIESGRRLQEDRLDGPIFPNAIAFSKNENFLKTNDGLLLLQGRSNVDQSLRSTVSSTQKWLCRGLSRMLRIPPDYRTRSSGSDTYPAVDTCGQLAALGHESGQVIFIEISTSD